MLLCSQDAVVGDVAFLEPGDIIPCDGLLITGHNVVCDESVSTGESEAISKYSCETVMGFDSERDHVHGITQKDCFLISGSKVQEGIGKYVIVAVGQKSSNGRLMIGEDLLHCHIFVLNHVSFRVALRGETVHTPLQLKLNILAELIARTGSIAGLVLFVALVIKLSIQLGQGLPVRYVLLARFRCL